MGRKQAVGLGTNKEEESETLNTAKEHIQTLQMSISLADAPKDRLKPVCVPPFPKTF